MQCCFGLARLSKNCVNKTSIILSKRANSSVAETFTRNGFVDQVLAIHLHSVWNSPGPCCSFRQPCPSESSLNKTWGRTWRPTPGTTFKVEIMRRQHCLEYFQPTLALSWTGFSCLVAGIAQHSFLPPWPRFGFARYNPLCEVPKLFGIGRKVLGKRPFYSQGLSSFEHEPASEM